jgi:hypothetical protein
MISGARSIAPIKRERPEYPLAETRIAMQFEITRSNSILFMTRYFIAANIWLAFGVIAILGCTNRNTETFAMSSFFNGPGIPAASYTVIEYTLFVMSAFFFLLTWKTRKNRVAR